MKKKISIIVLLLISFSVYSQINYITTQMRNDSRIEVNVTSYGVVGDSSTNNADAINALINAGYDLYFSDGNYLIGRRIVLKEQTSIRGADNANLIIANSYIYDTVNVASKDRYTAIYSESARTTVDWKGYIYANQDTHFPLFGNCVMIKDTYYTTLKNITGRKCHNVCMTIGVSYIQIDSITWSDAATVGNDYKNSAADIFHSRNITGGVFNCTGCEEVIDLNSQNYNVTLSDIVGNNTTQAVLEINNSINVVITNVSGTGNSEFLRAQNYAPVPFTFTGGYEVTYLNTNLTYANVNGNDTTIVGAYANFTITP